MHEATKDDDDQPIQWLDEDVVATEANWLVLIVDDEPEVHEVTKLVLSGLRFKDRGLDFVHAYDGEDARQKLLQNPQIAVILLDVVMETDDAGLRLVRHIRSELGNELVRIILRT
ncbi:MAG: response regulator, partial [Xanthomonadales bacterium]|nr:response regulator [Xanthomonadales bacterium]